MIYAQSMRHNTFSSELITSGNEIISKRGGLYDSSVITNTIHEGFDPLNSHVHICPL